MNKISHRFQQALDFVIDKGFATSESRIAGELGFNPSALNMAKKRGPSWELLLQFCDHYPINFWWLRSGEGDMIGGREREVALLKRIVELESRIAELERK